MNNRIYTLGSGWEIDAPERCCLFCDYCTDIYYDSKGIYLTLCELSLDVVEGSQGRCLNFKEDKR